MISPLRELAGELAAQGQTSRAFAQGSPLQQFMRRQGVQRSNEYERIRWLPKRRWQEQTTPAWTAELSAFLRRPGGEQTLRAVQAATLTDLYNQGGVVASVRVGGGKTHVSYLAGTVLDAARTVVLQPAKLEDKTLRDFEQLAKHWRSPRDVRVVNYRTLSLARYADLLFELEPDCLVFDEAHALRNLRAAVTMRAKRYVHERFRAGKRVHCVVLSGTPIDRSLRDMWHLLMWALPHTIPLPRNFNELQDWADAVDEKLPPEKRVGAGVLLELGAELGVTPPVSPEDELRVARQALRERLTLTPGYIATQERFDEVPLTLRLVALQPPPEVNQALDRLRGSWETPNGDLLTQATQVWLYATQLISGFWYEWVPKAPEWWLQPRRELNRFVREKLKHNRRGLDSPLQVHNEILRGGYPDGEALLAAWYRVRDHYKPKVVPNWISPWLVDYVSAWLKRPGNENTLVWIHNRAFGRALEAATGAPFFGESGLDRRGNYIEDHRGTAIVSIRSNAEGRNLQAWCSNLIVGPPTQGATMEQLLGRTHRDLQTRPVFATILAASQEQFAAWAQCERDATLHEHVIGQEQKLLYALRA